MNLLVPKASTPEFYSPVSSATSHEKFASALLLVSWSRSAEWPLRPWTPSGDITSVPQPTIPLSEGGLSSFNVLPDLNALAEAQGVRPIEDVDDLVADFWPEDESIDEFIATVRRWRDEEDTTQP